MYNDHYLQGTLAFNCYAEVQNDVDFIQFLKYTSPTNHFFKKNWNILMVV